MRTAPLLLDGEWLDTAEHADVTNPYSGEVVARVAQATAEDARRAVAAAARSLAAGPPPPHVRAEVLERTRTLVAEHADELARLIATEAGKPVTTAAAEVARCGDTLAYAAIEARTLAGSVVPFAGTSQGAGKLGFTLRKPKGVVAAITPFNFPLNLVAHKLAPAFAAGCPVVCKPAGDTPLSALRLAELLLEAGMPPGYLHVLPGPSSAIGPVLTGSDEVAVITFTGSTEVGRRLQAQAPAKTVLLELGSNSPAIVDGSADLARAASRLAATAFSYAGQSCISAQRVYVHTAVHDELVDRLRSAVGDLVVGDPLDPATDVGPLIRPEDRDRVLDWIREAEHGGAKVVVGGQVNDDGTLQPTVLDAVDPAMKVSREEVFGPVLAVRAVADLDEAIASANDSRYGLQAAIFTGSLEAALRAATELDFGGVLVNESPTFRADQQPYGGVRESGNTREGPAWALHDYLTETVVALELPAGGQG